MASDFERYIARPVKDFLKGSKAVEFDKIKSESISQKQHEVLHMTPTAYGTTHADISDVKKMFPLLTDADIVGVLGDYGRLEPKILLKVQADKMRSGTAIQTVSPSAKEVQSHSNVAEANASIFPAVAEPIFDFIDSALSITATPKAQVQSTPVAQQQAVQTGDAFVKIAFLSVGIIVILKILRS